jgi:SAM-dependent methyltransferase
VLSLAALHHVHDKPSFYREARRVLKPGGLLVVCDVFAASRTALFLDTIVDRYSATGHRGAYLDSNTGAELRAAGLQVLREGTAAHPWEFATPDEMIDFCRLLFGLERGSHAEVGAGIDAHLSHHPCGKAYCLDWELWSCQAAKA